LTEQLKKNTKLSKLTKTENGSSSVTAVKIKAPLPTLKEPNWKSNQLNDIAIAQDERHISSMSNSSDAYTSTTINTGLNILCMIVCFRT